MLFILASVFASLAAALFENHPQIRPLANFEQFNELLFQSDFVFVTYFYADDCENCIRAAGLIEKIAEDNEGLFKFYYVDCPSMWKDIESRNRLPYCDPSLLEQLPQISFFEPPAKRINPYTKQLAQAMEHRFQGEASPQSLAKFGFKLMPAHRTQLKTLQEFQKFEAAEPLLNKVILFTDKKQTSPLYKALTEQFLRRLHFGEVQEGPESQQLLDEFDIEEFPQLYILERKEDGSGFTREVYTGDLLFKQMKRYLDQYATKEKVEAEEVEEEIPKQEEEDPAEKRRRRRRERDGGPDEEPQQSKTLIKELTIEVLEKELLKNEKPALVHVYKEGAEHKLWEEIIKKYRSLFDYYTYKVENNDLNFAREHLGVRQAPTIRFFVLGSQSKKRANKIVFANDQSFDEVQKDIQDLIEDRTISVSERDIQMQLSSGLTEGKVLLFLFYNTPAPSLTYRVFASLSTYGEKFKFLSMKNAPEAILNQFQVRSQPMVIAIFREVQNKEDLEEEIKPEEVKSAGYTGKMSFEEFAQFLTIVKILIESLLLKQFDKEKEKSGKKVIEVKSQQELEELCSQRMQLCYIGLLNGQHKNV